MSNKKKEKFGGTISFKERIGKVEESLGLLFDKVKAMLDSAIHVLSKDDEPKFEELSKEIDSVHDLTDTLEDHIINAVTLHQPFGRNIRYLIAGLKISNEVHRCGHDAIHIAETSKFFDYSMECYMEVIEKVKKLAIMAEDMFVKAVDSYFNGSDVNLKEWHHMDDEVDDLHDEIIEEIKEAMGNNCANVPAGISLILATRYIERIADHACNIVEENCYVMSGERAKIE
ncbi:MAG: PhoU domain-containing protein [Asgard group archaeon]|nr:PhoU domain-containing protein [Asgard group archaeon]